MTAFRTMVGAATLVVGFGLAACGGSEEPGVAGGETIELQAGQALHPAGAGVETVEATQTPLGGTTDADPLDADLWSVDINVVMSQDATAGEVASAARATRAFSEQHVRSGPWTARVAVGTAVQVPEQDRTAPPVVQVDVYPTVQRSAAEDAKAAMQFKRIAGVDSVAITAGRPAVEVAAPADVVAVVEQLRGLPTWDEGGSVQSQAGRLRLSDVPARVTPAQVRAIVAVAVSYPRADVALESSGSSPELYVNKVTLDEARAIESALTAPSLASTTDDGFVLEFNVRASDEDRTVDTHGTFGVPDRS